MIFCQFVDYVPLREISNGLHSANGNLNHLGIPCAPSKSNLSYQNEKRSCEFFCDCYYALLNYFGQLPLKDSFTAIKIHFGEPGNLAYIRPNYAARMANLLRSFGAKPFLTDCNTLYSGRRSNAVDHLQSAMENGFNPISAQCQVIIADGLKGTDYREIPIDGEYCPAPKIGCRCGHNHQHEPF